MAKTGTKSVSATISAESYDAIEEYRWTVRKNLSQVVDQAVTEFIANHDIQPAVVGAPADQPTLAVVPDEKVKAGK